MYMHVILLVLCSFISAPIVLSSSSFGQTFFCSSPIPISCSFIFSSFLLLLLLRLLKILFLLFLFYDSPLFFLLPSATLPRRPLRLPPFILPEAFTFLYDVKRGHQNYFIGFRFDKSPPRQQIRDRRTQKHRHKHTHKYKHIDPEHKLSKLKPCR